MDKVLAYIKEAETWEEQLNRFREIVVVYEDLLSRSLVNTQPLLQDFHKELAHELIMYPTLAEVNNG